jgi:two-component sensor histidine kinase
VQLLRGTFRSGTRVSLRLEVPAAPIHIDLDRAVPCALLINELTTNAFKHAFPDERPGEIVIVLKPLDDGKVELSVADDGVGLPPDFDLDSVKSLGLQLVPLFVDQLGGELVMGNAPGAKFLLKFSTFVVEKERS